MGQLRNKICVRFPPTPRVVAYEPVPLFKSFFEYSVYLNDVVDLIDIRPTVVGVMEEQRMGAYRTITTKLR